MELLSFRPNAVVVIFGVGLMGQDLARKVLLTMRIKRLILVDAAAEITVGKKKMPLKKFAASLKNPDKAEILPITADITSEKDMAALFQKYRGVNYIAITSGISPRPLTPPEELPLDFFAQVINVNTLGPVNIINCAVRAKALAKQSRCVVMLSTSAKQGAQGRANSAYEISKWALRGFVTCQAGHYLRQHGVIINGISPNPLEGPMASGNPVSRRRVAAVIADTPLGLTRPENITAQIQSYWADECNSVGQTITVCGGYTPPKAIYGDLAGAR